MPLSWVRHPQGGLGRYASIATSSIGGDIEAESSSKQLDDEGSSNSGDDFGSNSSSSSSSSESATLMHKFKEKTEYRVVRRSRRLFTVLLGIVLIGGTITLLIIRQNNAQKLAASKWEDLYITNNVIAESIPDCTNCEPYSALPDHVLPQQSFHSFDSDSMDRWISKGKLPKKSTIIAANKLDFSKFARLDGVSFWVNGSDPRHKAARYHFSKNISQIDYRPELEEEKRSGLIKRNEILDVIQGLQNTDNRFREQNELLYSLRSAKESLGDNLGTLHVISTDYWANDKNEIKGKQDRLFQGRRGQLPSWLNVSSDEVAFGNEPSKQQGIRPSLRFHHDWETFAPMVKTRENIDQWKMKRLPSFNSIAAEAVLGVNIPSLSEYSFLASDDMFLGQKMSTADFVTPLYGPVLHLDMRHLVKPAIKPWSLGEMAGLRYSTHLLQKRFGTRQFPYPLHVHKAMSKPLLIESRMMWKTEFEKASTERFRGNGLMANSHMLMHGLTVERHREALLWTFLVAKIDIDGDGELNEAEVDAAFTLMGTDGYSDIIGRMKRRITTGPKNINKTLHGVSFPSPLSSDYVFSSLDGYALAVPSDDFYDATRIGIRDGPPRFFSSKQDTMKQTMRFSTDFCRVEMKTCWPHQSTDGKNVKTSDVFNLFAFQEPSCGDCLIVHLVGQSGIGGLEAFLPFANQTTDLPYTSTSSSVPLSVPAHLPLGDDWTTIDFSLSAVAGNNHLGWKRRDFSVALIQRYNYVVASASTTFSQVGSPSSAKLAFTKLLDRKTAFICINDDIRSWHLERTQKMMRSFFETMWPTVTTRLPFEKA